MGLIKEFKLVAQGRARSQTMGIRAMKAITILGVVGLVGVVALGAAAQSLDRPGGISGSEQTAKEVECNAQANAQDFGIHEYKRHRFVIRCIADLPQLGS
jgi:hypothetical protein